jgi:hypothetical protein
VSGQTGSEFRVYAADELGSDGYPPEWHDTLKHRVREEAGEERANG